ncbi:hypothetical protein HUE87_06325 [Candidatus Sulfurimonas marisnigri]|uniref:Campylobacter invasion antigen D C-terminal domain-containing protein n=1 Tax=Candidatus Sulfurimonas marisnigri TaxID=2740405 RepID=A0A7S7LYA7_9BACT|nr:hypothetical protein [Candidatus Sulfurimonas marisnigri]QOY53540.1 hypothetical protein HUE87_06325 [Candidatus Sulfurimonas marisnigri]
MELKDVILSTLAEMEDTNTDKSDKKPINNFQIKLKKEVKEEVFTEDEREYTQEKTSSDEMIFLISMRERLLVLFEGFQAPNNTNIEAKVDMTLNFLEYVLITLDERVLELEKGTSI